MNEMGIALVWLLMQVSIVAVAGLGLSSLAARRAPGAGAPAALTALAATVVLAALACCPLPAWWAWDCAMAHDVPNAAAEPAEDTKADGGAARGSDGVQLTALLALMRSLGRSPASAGAGAGAGGAVSWGWPAVVTSVAAVSTGLGMTRLLLGLWAIRQAKRRSRSVVDAEVLRLVAELSEALGVRRAVAVRESTELASAATIGWRRPIVLLPPDWRDWSALERRAAIAHELAHVRRGDFAAWLVARLSIAVHFWHPLVRALAGRLQLQQELAADAVAARLTGGGPVYLRALAELALRADGRADRWPAPAFLSGKGTLLRRIAMLRVTDDRSRRPLRPIVGGLAFALLCACTLIVSAWRFPGRAAFAGPPAADEVAPFDLSLVAQGKDQDGFYGIRPAALLNRPAAAPLRRLFNREIDTYTAPIEATGLGIHIEDVEQIMGRVMVGGENKPGKRTVMLSLNVVRMTHDMEWAKLRDQCGTLFKKHEWHGETYVSFPAPQLLSGITGIKGDMYLWAADARTLVQESPAVIKKLIEAKVAGKKLPVPAYTTGWNTVSRGLFAIALDNRGGRITKRCIAHSEMKDDTLKDVLAVCRHTSHLVAGCAGDDDLSFQLCAIADSAEAGAELAEAFRALIAMGKALSAAGKVTTDTSDSAARTLLQKAVARTTVRQSGNTVTIRAEAPSGFNALLAAYAKEAAREKH